MKRANDLSLTQVNILSSESRDKTCFGYAESRKTTV